MRQSGPRPRRRTHGAPALQPDDVLRHVLDATALLAGQRFLDELVRHLGLQLGVATVVVSETAEPDQVRLVSGWTAPGLPPPPDTAQGGMPCGEAARDAGAFWPSGLAEQYPHIPWLGQCGIVSCLCVGLTGESGRPLGTISILDTHPIESRLPAEAVLQTLAPRVAGELERRQTERVLRDSADRFRLLVEHAPDVIFRYDPSAHTFAYLSPAIEAMTGYRREDFQRDPSLPFRIVHHDDRPTLERMLASGEEAVARYRWVRRDGVVRWAESHNVPVRDETGALLAVEGVIRDVTDRVRLETALREAETHHRTLLEAFPDIVFRVSAEGVYLEAMAPEGLRVLLPAHAFPGKSLYDVLPLPVAEQAMRAIRTALSTGEPQRLEYTLDIAGEQRNEEARVLPLADGTVFVVVRLYSRGERAADPPRRLIEGPPARANPYKLTERELAVLQRIAEGAADKQIAEALGISSYTVNKHVASILAKMHVSSRTAACVRALREGLVG